MMNMHNAAIILDETLTTINCQFKGGDITYTFVCTKELAESIAVGDLVVAEVSKGLSIVTVKEIHKDTQITADIGINYHFAFQRVDTEMLDLLNFNINSGKEHLQQMQRDHMRNALREQLRSGAFIENASAGSAIDV